MKINNLFNQDEEITIESYLSKCGVEDVKEYIKGMTVEPTTHYDNIDEFAKGMRWCLQSNDKFYLLVDSDADGYFSSSMFYCYCKMVNPNCNIEPLFHNVNAKAHGLNDDEIMDYLRQQDGGYLFILDAGSNDILEDKELSGKYVVLCADHHISEQKNDYCILVNNQSSDNVTNKGLSGTGVSWKCCKRYDELYDCNFAPSLISYVYLSLLSDSMDLTYSENYSFVYWGRKKLHNNLLPFIEQLNSGDIGDNKSYSWGCIPKINATIRLGELKDKQDLFKGLCGEYEDIDELISRLKSFHNKQTNETKRLMDNSVEEIYNGKVYLGRIIEKSALSGLVANKLLSKENKPILLVHERENGECAGSVRSNIDLKDILNESGLFAYNLGHQCSFGTSYYKSNEQDIINYLDTSLTHLEPCTDVLIDSTIKCLPSNLFSFNEQYKGYFGVGIPIPQVHIKSFSINSQDIQVIGKNKTTIKFTKEGLSFIKFFCNEDIKNQLHLNDNKNYKMSMEVIGELGINEFRGKKSYQIIIDNYEVKDRNNLTVDDIF